MIVILKQDVKGTGKAGEIVKVNDGFARNMLIPRGLAMEATEGNVRSLEKQKALQDKKFKDGQEAARNQAENLKDKKVTIRTKVGEGGRLFGSITSKDVAEEASKQLGLKIDKKKLEMEGPIKQTGVFEIGIKLFSEVKGSIKVEVVDEAAE